MGAGETKGAAAKGRMVGTAVEGDWKGRGWRISGLWKEGISVVLLVEVGPPSASIPGRGPSSPPVHCGMGP